MRCRVPPLTGGLTGIIVVVEENGDDSVGEGGAGAQMRQRWHSLRRRGREAAGRRAGKQKDWMEVKMLEA